MTGAIFAFDLFVLNNGRAGISQHRRRTRHHASLRRAAEAARYVASTVVDVHDDPQNPTHSALGIDEEMVVDGCASLIVDLISLAVAIYLALP